MNRSRLTTLGLLVLLPVAFLIGVGFFHLWTTGWIFWAWWPMAGCLAAAYILAWRWQKQAVNAVADEPPPMHYSDRDKQAWKRIEQEIRDSATVDVDEMSGMDLYSKVAQKLGPDLAKIYHPNASDPVGNLTIPEVLAVVELAASDLGVMARDYLPGGHLVTLDRVRQAQRAVKWYQRANQTYWAAAAVFDPIRTGMRYVAARAGLGKPLDLVKENLFLWFFAQYVRKLGFYMIELYSGRLKVGVERYKQLRKEAEAAERDSRVATDGTTIVVDTGKTAEARAVTIAVIGQVKAGKSSLINALLGDQRAHTDVIPATAHISRYELTVGNSRLILLDTVGYNQVGPDEDQFDATVDAAQQADLIFMVTHARNPGRDADVKLWKELTGWFKDRPELKMPPALVVLTHIDLLTPAMEWAPPYQWRTPTRLKEQQIAEAVKAAAEQFGDGPMAVVPVCTAEKKVVGIQEELIPQMTTLLGEARAVAFLRCVSAEADERQLERMFEQVKAAGRLLLSQMMK